MSSCLIHVTETEALLPFKNQALAGDKALEVKQDILEFI